MTIRFERPVTREQFAQAWAEVSEETRSRCIEHLRASYPATFFDDVRRLAAADPDGWAHASHFFSGMTVRNVLHEVVRDDELPGVFYGWVEGLTEPIHNWDDYYVQALEEAAGLESALPEGGSR